LDIEWYDSSAALLLLGIRKQDFGGEVHKELLLPLCIFISSDLLVVLLFRHFTNFVTSS
jgi:hypothetical protein